MTSPAQYRHQIAELTVEDQAFEGAARENAPAAIEKLAEIQQKAQEIERAISVDIHLLRSQYRSRVTSASTGLSGGALPDKRHRGQNARASETEKVNQELEAKLGPFEEAKKEIDELLARLSIARTELEKKVEGDRE